MPVGQPGGILSRCVLLTLTPKLGCGTAIPSCYLFSAIFQTPAKAKIETPTVLSLCDYNEEVLSLVCTLNLGQKIDA